MAGRVKENRRRAQQEHVFIVTIHSEYGPGRKLGHVGANERTVQAMCGIPCIDHRPPRNCLQP